MTALKQKKWFATLIMVGIPLIIVIIGGIYVWKGTQNQEDLTIEDDSNVPDAYSSQTFDRVPDPTAPRTCVEDMSSYELIKDSEGLKDSGLKIWIGGSFDNGLNVPKACASKEKGPFSVITRTGIASVVESPDTSETVSLDWECGGLIPAQKYLFKADENPGESLFLVSGENAEARLKWHPAKLLGDKDQCVSTDPDYQISGNVAYEVADLKLTYYVQKWKVKASETEACTLPVAALDRLVLNEKSACDRQLESQFNCHGLPTDTDANEDPGIGRILGVLTIQGDTDEKWLVFESPGYEWMGYSVAPIDGLGRIDKKRLKTLIYSGC